LSPAARFALALFFCFVFLAGDRTIFAANLVVDGTTLSITTNASYDNILVAPNSDATLNHSSGLVTATAVILGSTAPLGSSTGTYNLSGTGSLSVAIEDLNNSPGNFHQSDGYNTVANDLTIGVSSSYYLSDGPAHAGILTVYGTEYLNGLYTVGFTQLGTGSENLAEGNESLGGNSIYQNNGGLNIVFGTLSLAAASQYQLNVGILQASAIVGQPGTAQLQFNGGTLRAYGDSASLITGSDSVFVGFGGAKIDTNGHNITIAVPLTGNSGPSNLGLRKLGAGVLTLTGTNTYFGGTTISAGTLQIGTGGTTGSITGNVTDNAALLFNRSDNPNFTGNISGSGSVSQAGTGTLTLSGSHTYAGATTVSAGTLIVSGSLNGTASVTVGDGTNPAALGGNGTITPKNAGTLTVMNGATLAPAKGNSSGLTLNAAVSGNVTVAFQSGSTFQLSMANNQALIAGAPALADYSKLTIGTGVSVTLGGNIVTGFDGTMNNGDLFVIILNGGSVSGLFANTTTPAPNSAGSTYRFSSNGLMWDINYAWTGSTTLANQNVTSFEQTTGGHNVALLLVTVPEPGSPVSLLGGCGLFLSYRRFRRRA